MREIEGRSADVVLGILMRRPAAVPAAAIPLVDRNFPASEPGTSVLAVVEVSIWHDLPMRDSSRHRDGYGCDGKAYRDRGSGWCYSCSYNTPAQFCVPPGDVMIHRVPLRTDDKRMASLPSAVWIIRLGVFLCHGSGYNHGWECASKAYRDWLPSCGRSHRTANTA